MDKQERIQINRDSLKKIITLTAESKIDKIRIKKLEDGLMYISIMDSAEYQDRLITYIEKLLKKDNQ